MWFGIANKQDLPTALCFNFQKPAEKSPLTISVASQLAGGSSW